MEVTGHAHCTNSLINRRLEMAWDVVRHSMGWFGSSKKRLEQNLERLSEAYERIAQLDIALPGKRVFSGDWPPAVLGYVSVFDLLCLPVNETILRLKDRGITVEAQRSFLPPESLENLRKDLLESDLYVPSGSSVVLETHHGRVVRVCTADG